MSNKENWIEEFEERYLPQIVGDNEGFVRNKYMFPDGGFAQDVKDFISKTIEQAIKQERKRVSLLLAEEIVIAQKEGQPTSRLTSLGIKI